jgi:hypothetical protein
MRVLVSSVYGGTPGMGPDGTTRCKCGDARACAARREQHGAWLQIAAVGTQASSPTTQTATMSADIILKGKR